MFIPDRIPRKKKVALYCRVSTTHPAQEDSLEAQKNDLKWIVKNNPDWELYDVYMDQDTGGTTARLHFLRLIDDCYANRMNIILVKSISRFTRNTEELLRIVNNLSGLKIGVIFDSENIRTGEAEHDVLMAILTAIEQGESESMSEAIKRGIRRRMESGKSKLYVRKCLGYTHDEKGLLVPEEKQARVVRQIFNLYLAGYSVDMIIKDLECTCTKSPRGKDKWSKLTVTTVLTNEKYTGNVILGKTYTDEFPNNRQHINKGENARYRAEDAHEAIIDMEMFEQVHKETDRRSSIEVVDGVVRRKETHYSGKKIRKQLE